jgi:hypothetical protein
MIYVYPAENKHSGMRMNYTGCKENNQARTGNYVDNLQHSIFSFQINYNIILM